MGPGSAQDIQRDGAGIEKQEPRYDPERGLILERAGRNRYKKVIDVQQARQQQEERFEIEEAGLKEPLVVPEQYECQEANIK